MKKIGKPKILTIVGPTASGKSDLAVKIAEKYNGEIISADSRQVYKGLNIGTGKITKKEMRGVPHHLLDVADPKKRFTVSDFKDLADKAIEEIASRGKLPILCGGTGFYIDAVVNNVLLPDVKPDNVLRKKLFKKSNDALFKMLQKMDSERAKSIDKRNKIRVIRAIEISKALGKVPPITADPKFKTIFIGIKMDKEMLQERISKRLISRLKKGMINEAKKLHAGGLSYKRMEELGLEYRFLAQLLQNKISKIELITKLNTEIWHYARRQIQWFKRNKKIKWFALKEKGHEIDRVLSSFYNYL